MEVSPISTHATETDKAPSVSKKRRASKACVFCNKSHISCEDARPCARCVHRGIGHLCKDASTAKRGRKSYLHNIDTNTQIKPCSVTSLLNVEPSDNSKNHKSEFEHLLSDFLPSKLKTSTKFTELLINKFPNSSEAFLARFRSAREKLEKYLEKFPQESLQETLEADILEVQVWTRKYEQMFCQMTIPTFVYDRNGALQYVNPAYRALTGFNAELPLGEHSFHALILSKNGFLEYFDLRFKLMENLTLLNTTSNGLMFKSSIKLYDKYDRNSEKTLEGTMAINFKLDRLGIPFLMLGFFLPTDLKDPLVLDLHTRV